MRKYTQESLLLERRNQRNEWIFQAIATEIGPTWEISAIRFQQLQDRANFIFGIRKFTKCHVSGLRCKCPDHPICCAKRITACGC